MNSTTLKMTGVLVFVITFAYGVIFPEGPFDLKLSLYLLATAVFVAGYTFDSSEGDAN